MTPRGDLQLLALSLIIKTKANVWLAQQAIPTLSFAQACAKHLEHITELRALKMPNYVFVIDTNFQPLNPIPPKKAQR